MNSRRITPEEIKRHIDPALFRGGVSQADRAEIHNAIPGYMDKEGIHGRGMTSEETAEMVRSFRKNKTIPDRHIDVLEKALTEALEKRL